MKREKMSIFIGVFFVFACFETKKVQKKKT